MRSDCPLLHGKRDNSGYSEAVSQQNVEIIRIWVDAYNCRDIDAVLALSDPAIEFRSVFAGIESGGAFQGHRGLRDYFAAIEDAYESFELRPLDFLDAGAAVVVAADASWAGRGSGVTGVTPVFPVFWLRAKFVIWAESSTDRAVALEAAGLSE